jgi:hypothetical protein
MEHSDDNSSNDSGSEWVEYDSDGYDVNNLDDEGDASTDDDGHPGCLEYDSDWYDEEDHLGCSEDDSDEYSVGAPPSDDSQTVEPHGDTYEASLRLEVRDHAHDNGLVGEESEKGTQGDMGDYGIGDWWSESTSASADQRAEIGPLTEDAFTEAGTSLGGRTDDDSAQNSISSPVGDCSGDDTELSLSDGDETPPPLANSGSKSDESERRESMLTLKRINIIVRPLLRPIPN